MSSRYQHIGLLPGGRGLATSNACYKIWSACVAGAIGFETHTLDEAERLDHIAGKHYGDATLWWVIAGASGIGWSLQAPAGTFIRIPTDLNEVRGLV